MPELEPDGHESAGKPKQKDKDLIVEGIRDHGQRSRARHVQLIDANLGH
jgi:hypothetical protein